MIIREFLTPVLFREYVTQWICLHLVVELLLFYTHTMIGSKSVNHKSSTKEIEKSSHTDTTMSFCIVWAQQVHICSMCSQFSSRS